jgi:ADP-heptose:LPS heptosyltransferase
LGMIDAYDERIDLAINLHGCGPQSHRALLRRHPSRLVAFRHEEIEVEGPPWMPHQHEVDRWCDLVNICLTLDADPEDLALPFPAMRRDDRLVVLHAGASDPDKQWPWESMAHLARELASRGHVIALTGDGRDRETVEHIRAAAGLPMGSVLAGLTDIDALLSVIGRARLLVSGDTGAGHIATALGTPSIVMFGPTDPAVWGPRSGPHVVLRAGQMRDIPVDAVLIHAEALLAMSLVGR